MKPHLRRIFAITASVALVASLSACGGDDDDAASETPPQASVPQGATLQR